MSTLEMVYDDDLRFLLGLGQANIFNASHVVPVGLMFNADLTPSGGPVLGEFELYSQAVEAEQQWINNKIRASLGYSSGEPSLRNGNYNVTSSP